MNSLTEGYDKRELREAKALPAEVSQYGGDTPLASPGTVWILLPTRYSRVGHGPARRGGVQFLHHWHAGRIRATAYHTARQAHPPWSAPGGAARAPVQSAG